MEKHQIVIDIATYGWEREPWQGFYPADLPEDWHLDFYSNEFRSVVVPFEMWQGISPEVMDEWLDAVDDDFCFYFEVTGEPNLFVEHAAVIDSFGTQFGGLVCQNSIKLEDTAPSLWYEGEATPRQMSEAIEQLHAALGHDKRGVIVVSTANEPWQVASDMRQLVELMGYG